MKNNKKVSDFLFLTKQWNYKKNILKTEDLAAQSNKKVWWICEVGHEWEAIIYNCYKGQGCPYCSGKRVFSENCLEKTHYELSQQWHSIKNGSLTSEDVTAGSNKKVWWKCDKGEDHEWIASVVSRVCRRSGCPCCSGRQSDKNTCMEVKNPEISKEWDYEKNGTLTPKNIMVSSSKKVWWKCSKGHSYQSSPNSRSSMKTGCPYCVGKKVCLENCLNTKNPTLSEEWNYEKNVNLTPKDVTSGSGKSVYWRCKKGHEWKARIVDRNCGFICPYCAGRKACKDNCLKMLKPELSKEWDCRKNGILTPEDVTLGSGKNIYWKCLKKGHEWTATVSNRVKGSGCPTCHESRGEKRVAEVLHLYKINFSRQHRISDCRKKSPLPFDFKIDFNNKMYLIEYQGIQHYKQTNFYGFGRIATKNKLSEIRKRDKIKKEFCAKNNIPLLVISYLKFDKIEKLLLDFLL